MKIKNCLLQNFASYRTLEFSFSDQGLTLIQGPTGAGKSTLCDAIPWILFGKTAKGGAADEVLSWPGNEVTTGRLDLYKMSIFRSRGPKAKDNDLYWMEYGGYKFSSNHVEHRGKDLNDTQKLINAHLALDYETYLAGAYFHEFSQTAQFFSTSAKNRRAICENLVDLTLAQKLQTALSEQLKTTKHSLEEVRNSIRVEEGKLSFVQNAGKVEEIRASEWVLRHTSKLKELKDKAKDFETQKERKIAKLARSMEEDLAAKQKSAICSECGAPKAPSKMATSSFSAYIEAEKASVNPYPSLLEAAKGEKNPHNKGVKDYSQAIRELTQSITAKEQVLAQVSTHKSDIETLQQTIAVFRSSLIENTIADINNTTNSLIDDFFEGEFRVQFDIQEDDKLEVEIFREENFCSYTQLSKGQRQILKLCFGISVMKAIANHHQVDSIFLDEAFDGLDDIMKQKVFRLLQMLELSYNSIFVVEHSNELKSLFNNQFNVTLINGISQIEKA